MMKKQRTVYILISLAALLGVAAYFGFGYGPSQARERPTLVYFYSGT